MTNYSVQSGDTLQKISDKFYGNPRLYTLIQQVNNITNPSQIRVGQLLRIPPSPNINYTTYHQAFANGVRWRLREEGIEIEGSGIERTPGIPQTMTRIWQNFNQEINQWARYYNVPCVAILATIATESGGNPNSVREEPGYISDTATPGLVSPGLMQTLISTARETLRNSAIDRQFLLNPSNSIQAGTAFISRQRSQTLLDPPKIAAAYNSGGVYENTNPNNRWRMRQYPLGTSHHCDRYVKWFNDAVFVLNQSNIAASVPYGQFYLSGNQGQINGDNNSGNNPGTSVSKFKVVNNTIFKFEPKEVFDLANWQIINALPGEEYEYINYERILGNHRKINLVKPLNFGSKQSNIIYVFADDIALGSDIPDIGNNNQPKLIITTNTVLKSEPKKSSDLASWQKLNAISGQQYQITSSELILDNHLKISLAQPLNFGSEPTNIIYVFADHVKVSGLTSKPQTDINTGGQNRPNSGVKLKILANTFFKDQPVQAVNLTNRQKVAIAPNSEYLLQSYQSAANNHVRITLATPILGTQGKTSWYVFAPHIEIEGNEPGNNPKDQPTPKPPGKPQKTGAFRLPGSKNTFYLSDPIIPGGNFTWAEATKNGTRIPVNPNVVAQIIKIARSMEDVRKYLGSRPITVNSWYRDPKTNASVGGAKNSRHLVGDAVDFTVEGIPPSKVKQMLDPWWGNKGGLASGSDFTHIDQRGYRARWTYDH